MAPIGSPFQQKICKISLTIPKGKTITYTEVADYHRNKKSVRAVGAAPLEKFYFNINTLSSHDWNR